MGLTAKVHEHMQHAHGHDHAVVVYRRCKTIAANAEAARVASKRRASVSKTSRDVYSVFREIFGKEDS